MGLRLAAAKGRETRMKTNTELKAVARHFAKQESTASAMADGPPQTFEQCDTFFVVPHGRLKLREIPNDPAQLNHYLRPSEAGIRAQT